MGRRKRVSEEERSQWVARWRSSGLTAKQFGREHHIAASTLYAWERSVKEPDRRAVAFTQVRLGEASRASAGTVEFVLPNGVVARFCGHIEAAQVRRLLEAARAC